MTLTFAMEVLPKPGTPALLISRAIGAPRPATGFIIVEAVTSVSDGAVACVPSAVEDTTSGLRACRAASSSLRVHPERASSASAV